MSKLASRLAAILALGVISASVAVAAPGDKKAASAPKCSACGMTLTAKKDKTHTKAVKVNGKTYYCCSGCKMGGKTAPKAGKM